MKHLTRLDSSTWLRRLAAASPENCKIFFFIFQTGQKSAKSASGAPNTLLDQSGVHCHKPLRLDPIGLVFAGWEPASGLKPQGIVFGGRGGIRPLLSQSECRGRANSLESAPPDVVRRKSAYQACGTVWPPSDDGVCSLRHDLSVTWVPCRVLIMVLVELTRPVAGWLLNGGGG